MSRVTKVCLIRNSEARNLPVDVSVGSMRQPACRAFLRMARRTSQRLREATATHHIAYLTQGLSAKRGRGASMGDLAQPGCLASRPPPHALRAGLVGLGVVGGPGRRSARGRAGRVAGEKDLPKLR